METGELKVQLYGSAAATPIKRRRIVFHKARKAKNGHNTLATGAAAAATGSSSVAEVRHPRGRRFLLRVTLDVYVRSGSYACTGEVREMRSGKHYWCEKYWCVGALYFTSSVEPVLQLGCFSSTTGIDMV
jgi:hypothetical protein